jgi:hypothetical protein
MSKKKLIINIDGPRGVGKTTQIYRLYNHAKNLGLDAYVDVSDSEIKDKLLKSIDLLRNGSDICFNEGSFLRVLAEDFVSGLPKEKVLEKNRKLIELNENTRHEFTNLNVIMLCDNLMALKDRLDRFVDLTGKTIIEPDMKKEADILTQIIGFENSLISWNVDTKIIYIEPNQSIIDVTEKLIETIGLSS